jgi:hypothetical protein
MKQKNRTQTRFRSQIRTYLVQERHTTSSLTQGGSANRKSLRRTGKKKPHIMGGFQQLGA